MEAHALIEEGAAHRDNGSGEVAAARWLVAHQIAQELGARLEEAYALLLLACLYHVGGHPEADDLWLRAAGAILTHGYTYLLERERAVAFPWVAAYTRRREAPLRQPAERLLASLGGVAALPLHIRGLGEFQLCRGARPIARKALQRRRAGELLRFLLLQPHLRAQRELVIEALWPDQPPGKGLALLHQATSALRRLLEPDLPDKFPSRYLSAGGEQISLRLPTGSTVDFLEFRALLSRPDPTPAEIQTALALFQGDLYPDDRYADWAEPARAEYAHLYQEALSRRAAQRLAAGDVLAALQDCRTLLARDPCHEDATLLAMQASLHLADRPAALRYYQRLEKALEQEFGLTPRADLTRYVAELRRKGRQTWPDSA